MTEIDNALSADDLLYAFQREYECNLSDVADGYRDEYRDPVRDALLFAFDNGWRPTP